MKIYIVRHDYDNGESYEDYREYKDYSMFSSLELASTVFWREVASEDGYEGRYYLLEWELDTQKVEILEDSPWIRCTSQYDYDVDCFGPTYCDEDSWEDDYLEKYYWNGLPKHPEDSIELAWEFIEWEDPYYIDDDGKEDTLTQTYLNSEGTNYHEWQECEKEFAERKSKILLEELDKSLLELLKI